MKKFIQVLTILALSLAMVNCKELEELPGDETELDNPNNEQDTDAGFPQKFCSPLSFKNVQWPKALTDWERRSFALSLSISGSFEGPNGWKNITNNFDGMGLSAGLLNQTLGTSSLQPLLSVLKNNRPDVLEKTLSPERRISLVDMIETWEAQTGKRLTNPLSKMSTEEIELSDADSSRFDVFDATNKPVMQKSSVSPAQTSVRWAVDNLYQANGSFKPAWRSELQKMLATPEYVSLQIAAAYAIHKKAMSYIQRVGKSDLRTYQLMFDVVVQNGGIREVEFDRWQEEVSSLGITKSSDQLKKLIQIRAERVRPQYKNDVLKRKFALIDGKGVVHGSNRDFQKQYCFNATDKLK